MTDEPRLTPMPPWQSVLFFGVPTILFYFVSRFGIALLRQHTPLHPLIIWFLTGGPFFVLLFLTSIVAYRIDRAQSKSQPLRERFRLQAMRKGDWLWTLGALLLASISMGIIYFIASWLTTSVLSIGQFNPSASFLKAKALSGAELWILLAWIPHFFFNIVGEEFLWRGYILPRQELTHGRFTWIVQGVLWSAFHIPFGWQMTLLVLPLLFGIPYVVQKRKNTWIGIMLHAVINGGGFLAVSFGLI